VRERILSVAAEAGVLMGWAMVISFQEFLPTLFSPHTESAISDVPFFGRKEIKPFCKPDHFSPIRLSLPV